MEKIKMEMKEVIKRYNKIYGKNPTEKHPKTKIYNDKGLFMKEVDSMIKDTEGNVIGHIFYKTNLLAKYCK